MMHFDITETSEYTHHCVVTPATPTGLWHTATQDIAVDLNALFLQVPASVVQTRNSHWCMRAACYPDYLMHLDDQTGELFALTDCLSERIQKMAERAPSSIGQLTHIQSEAANTVNFVKMTHILADLCDDHQTLAANLQAACDVCNEFRDRASASLVEAWIDATEDRFWVQFELTTASETTSH